MKAYILNAATSTHFPTQPQTWALSLQNVARPRDTDLMPPWKVRITRHSRRTSTKVSARNSGEGNLEDLQEEESLKIQIS